jgi:hypothetical protein
MGALIPFTSNYSDVSTYEGYQFEFCCLRCGNGYRSAFRHSVTGFGGRLAVLGGSLLGGEIGSRVQEVGFLAQYGRSSTRGSTNDERLLEAAQDVAGQFHQCRRCAHWVCGQVCWNAATGCCADCAPAPAPMPMPMAIGPAHAQCTRCGNTGSGRFCGSCGNTMAPPRPAGCRGCGNPLQGTPFCPHCGTPAG